MLALVTVIHVLLCVFMIFVILLQPGKDAGMGSALGGGAATSAFGGRGAVTFLSKVTAACAVLFFLTSLGLSFVGLKSSVAEGDDETPAAATAKADGGVSSSATPTPASPLPGGAAAPSTGGAPSAADRGSSPHFSLTPGGAGASPLAPSAKPLPATPPKP